MNFIFVSPHFPNTYWNFCDRLHRNGVNVPTALFIQPRTVGLTLARTF